MRLFANANLCVATFTTPLVLSKLSSLQAEKKNIHDIFLFIAYRVFPSDETITIGSIVSCSFFPLPLLYSIFRLSALSVG
jgi:hypothetical protein